MQFYAPAVLHLFASRSPVSATTNLKVKSRKNLDRKKEPQRLLPSAAFAPTKPKARNNSQPTRRKTPLPRHQPKPRSQADAPVSDAAARGAFATFSARRKNLFRTSLHTWRKLRRKLCPSIRRRRYGRFALNFRARRSGSRRAILSARLKALTFPLKRPAQLIRGINSSLRRKFSARVPHLRRYVFRPDNDKLSRGELLKGLNRVRITGA